MGYYSENYNQTVKDVLGELDKALGAVDPETVEKFVKAVLEADQVYFVESEECFFLSGYLQEACTSWN